MTDTTGSIMSELAQFTARVLAAAVANGSLTPEDLEAAKDAMRAGAVVARRGEDGTIEVVIGTTAIVELHLLDLPSAAAEWEAKIT